MISSTYQHYQQRERKKEPKKERETTTATIFSLQKQDILTLLLIGHFYFALT